VVAYDSDIALLTTRINEATEAIQVVLHYWYDPDERQEFYDSYTIDEFISHFTLSDEITDL
jgi:primase-polymerase (primpol)-like protein